MKKERCIVSFIIHTEIAKAAHQNQENIINELFERIRYEVEADTELIQSYSSHGCQFTIFNL